MAAEHGELTEEVSVDMSGVKVPGIEVDIVNGRMAYAGTDIPFVPEDLPGARVKRRWVTEWVYDDEH